MFRTSLLAVLLTMTNALPATLLVDPSIESEDTYSTIQSAVDAAKPGDTVQIRGGIYYEHVIVKNSGEPGRPITIQGAPNELVVVNAGKKLEADFKPAKDLPDVFVADVDPELFNEPVGFWESSTRLRLAPVLSPAQASHRLGSWHYDTKTGKLYIRSSGFAPADQVTYWIESSSQSAIKVNASHVTIRNLEATLGQHGVIFEGKASTHGTVENIRAYCNSWAGIHVTGDHHLIRNNETFQNNTYGIQLRYGVNNVHVLNNLCYYNGPDNGEATGSSVPTDLGIYSQGGFNLFEGNIVEGLHEDVYRNKTGHGANPTNVLRNNVIKGHQTPGPYGVYDNTLIVSGLGMRGGMYRNGGEPSPLRSWEYVDPTGIQRETNLIWPLNQKENPRFADPAYRDYRLQGDSPYHGLGAYPGRVQVFYVDPQKGSDENSGLSVSQALASLSALPKRLSASSTVYLLPGDHAAPEEPIVNGGLDSNDPLRFRAYNKSDDVRITGSLKVDQSQFVSFEGVEFTSRLEVTKTSGVKVDHCVFSGKDAGISAVESPQLKVDRCTFVDNTSSLVLEKSPNACITQSLFAGNSQSLTADKPSAETAFLAFNAFDSFKGGIAGKTVSSLDEANLRTTENRVGEKPRLANGSTLAADHPLTMAGSDFGYVGARVEHAAARLEIRNLRIAGLSPEGATLLWESPRKATFAELTLKEDGREIRTWEPVYLVQIMGTNFDVTKLVSGFFSTQRNASLSDLKPDTDYSVTLVARDAVGNRSEPHEVSFRTPSEYRPAETYYLAPNGSDQADGKTESGAWKTFAHALSHVGPGDEVVLLPGDYQETLRPVISGTKGHKITIRSKEPLGAALDLAESLPIAVELANVDHVEISGLLIKNGDFPRSQCFQLNHAKGITIRDCELAYPRESSFEKLKLGYNGLVASKAPGLHVENNLFLCSVTGVGVAASPGTVIRHNTFLGEGNYGVVIVPGSSDEEYTIEYNLFYRAVMGYKTGPCIWVFKPMPRLVSDHNLFFIPETHKGTIGMLPDTDRLFPLELWTKETGLDKNSIQAQPNFVDPENRNLTLKAGSPGKGAAEDGKDIGRNR